MGVCLCVMILMMMAMELGSKTVGLASTSVSPATMGRVAGGTHAASDGECVCCVGGWVVGWVVVCFVERGGMYVCQVGCLSLSVWWCLSLMVTDT